MCICICICICVYIYIYICFSWRIPKSPWLFQYKNYLRIWGYPEKVGNLHFEVTTEHHFFPGWITMFRSTWLKGKWWLNSWFFFYTRVYCMLVLKPMYLAESTGLGMIQIQNGSSSPTTWFLSHRIHGAGIFTYIGIIWKITSWGQCR